MIPEPVVFNDVHVKLYAGVATDEAPTDVELFKQITVSVIVAITGEGTNEVTNTGVNGLLTHPFVPISFT